jgi:hypothetical protein
MIVRIKQSEMKNLIRELYNKVLMVVFTLIKWLYIIKNFDIHYKVW